MPGLVIFDFDDTILHLDVRWDAVRNDVIALARKDGEAANPKQHLVPLGNWLSGAPHRKNAIDGIYLRHEAECIGRKGYVVFPKMLALAKELKAGGRKLAIASGNHTENISRILAELGETGLFSVVCGRDLVRHNKPAPDQIFFVLEKTGSNPEDALFVGDSPNDAAAAKAAGVSHFHVRPNDESDIKRLRELLLCGSPRKD